ncbi:MAG TPA: MiaB/RimO family radical SAM methylthiotransferase, partial [Tepidisphaeraceae bacterium]
SHQRAFLKIQDGCDAHCTYCIIPSLRPTLWSKPIDDAVAEAQRLVAAGHREIVLTGIFLGAFGQPTALRRRQPEGDVDPLVDLIDALCTQVEGLVRLRLSSMEPGDLTPGLIDRMKRHKQIVPHFHLPLQAGSDRILRKMNRQYDRSQFLNMITLVNDSFDRPAITTDIIAGFPGETDADFEQTLDIVDKARFIHTHAFTYSPRPGTAAARWEKERVNGQVANERIKLLQDRAREHSEAFRRQFISETATVLVEREGAGDGVTQHGRCERYFDIHFDAPDARPGDLVTVQIDRIQNDRTFGSVAKAAH